MRMDTSPISTSARNLLFHTIGLDHPGSISTKNLEHIIERQLSEGKRAASLQDFLTHTPPGPDAFTVSFDDAHPSVLRSAVPVLREFKVPATVFVPTAYVEETDWVMGWDDLRALASLPGWTIGSHGSVHQRMSWRLYREDASAHFSRLLADATQSRAWIKDKLSFAPDLFAYPFGEAPIIAQRAVKEAGYGAAFSVDVQSDWDGNLLAIPRLDGAPVSCPTQEVIGISVIVPACDRVTLLHEVVRRLSAQSYPRDRYEVLVIDDGSANDLARVLAPFVDGSVVRVIRLPGSDRTFRAGQAREKGSQLARFPVLSFLDSDVAVDQDYLWHLAWCHRSDPQAVVFGYLSGYNLHDLGYVHQVGEISKAVRLSGDEVPIIPDRSREPVLRSCLDNLHALSEPWKLAYTGNLSLSKALLEKVGGFSSNFSGWGFEDVDLGFRLQQADAHFWFSRWALGYHLADPAEQEPHTEKPSRNPFRDSHPTPERFGSVLRNLETFQNRHPENPAVTAFCANVRSDVTEILSPPSVVGVEMGAGYPFPWPFRRLHKPHPGGIPFEEILDRLAYAHRLGSESLYLLGGDVPLRPDLCEVLDRAVELGIEWITLETTAIPFAQFRLAAQLRRRGLTGATVEILAGKGYPVAAPWKQVMEGVKAMRDAGLELGVKLVLGEDNPSRFREGLEQIGALRVPLHQVMVLTPSATSWVRASIEDSVALDIV